MTIYTEGIRVADRPSLEGLLMASATDTLLDANIYLSAGAVVAFVALASIAWRAPRTYTNSPKRWRYLGVGFGIVICATLTFLPLAFQRYIWVAGGHFLGGHLEALLFFAEYITPKRMFFSLLLVSLVNLRVVWIWRGRLGTILMLSARSLRMATSKAHDSV